MKTTIQIVVILLLCSFTTKSFTYPPPDSCLKLVDFNGADTNFVNLDSLKIDSCELSGTYLERYSKGKFDVKFNYNIIKKAGIYPADTIIEYTWSDIDTIYSTTRVGFQQLETDYGSFYFREKFPHRPDTNGYVKRTLFIHFENYINIDSIKKDIKLIPNVLGLAFRGTPKIITHTPTDQGFDVPTSIENISVNNGHTDEWFPQNHHKTGWHWNHYALKTPLAWELTKGASSINIGTAESLGGTISHPDMTANFVEYSVANSNLGDGLYETEPLRNGHGLYTLSVAIGDDDNNYPLVGTCPDCEGFYTSWNSSIEFNDIDVDKIAGNGLTPPHVVYQAASYDYNELDNMAAGIVLLAAAGNQLIKYGYGSDSYVYTSFYPPYSKSVNTFWMGKNFYDPNHPADIDFSLKPITVAALASGRYKNRLCDTWVQADGVKGSNFQGEERFAAMPRNNFGSLAFGNSFTFSYDIKKFSPLLSERDQAFVDVVSPSMEVLEAQYDDDGAQWGMGNGTSEGVGMTAGVVGLMRSINNELSQIPSSYIFLNKEDIHRTAYNIITFTAEKLYDDGYMPNVSYPYGYSTTYPAKDYFHNNINNGLNFQYNYIVQEDDVLKRSWAQRMGFGKVNAYRSVAHSIRQKGDYEYSPLTTTYTIPMLSLSGGSTIGYSLPSGKKIMHWGAKVKEGTGEFEVDISRGPTTGNDGELRVLEYGGVSMPGEFHNNQGVTLINNSSGSPSRTQFQVPTNSILAIDGILTTDQPSLSHYVVTQGSGSSASKILAEGLVKDVEIFGNLRIGDITVSSTIDNGAGAIGFGSPFDSEVYGDVYVNDFAYFYLWGNCHLQPGAIINLNGAIDLLVNGSSELHLAHATKIKTNNSRKVIIHDGTKLVIDENAVTDLELEVFIKDGGELVLEDNAKAKIKFLNVERGGSVILNEGSLLALEEQEHYINGKLLVSGNTENKATITGYIREHCEPYDHEDYDDFKYIETTPIIYMQGHCDSLDKSQLDLQNVDFKDISLNVFNIPVYQTIRNVNFQTKTRETNPFFHFPYLFSLNFDNCADCTNPFVQNIRISNSSFKDYSQPIAPANEPGNINKLEFRTAGLSIEGYDQVEITGTDFSNLEYGVSTFDCNKVLIQTSNFDSCGIGDYNFGSETYLCQNDYNIVKYGSVRDHSLEGRAFNNTYTKTLIGYNAVSSDEQRFRGNDFNEYLKGISSSCTELVLADKIEGGNYLIYGRNTFNISPLLPDLSEYTNPFIRKTCLVSESADINLNKSCCALTMRCGLNQMSTNSTYHLKYNGTGTFGPIDINYNTFPDPTPGLYIPRALGVSTIFASMANIDFRWTGLDSLCCGDWAIDTSEYDCPPPVTHGTETATCSPIYLFGIPYPPIAKKGFVYEGDYATTHKKEVLDWISNINGNEVIKSFKYEKETGSNYSQRRESLNDLLIDYSRNQLDVLDSYDTPYNSHPNIVYSKDKKANQIQGVSLLGFVDRLMGVDCSQNQSTTNVEDDGLFASVSINEIAPNPTNNLISVELSSDKSINLKINVIDQLGKTVSKLFESQIDYGKTNKQFDISNLTSGIYYITFEWSGNRITKKIILNK